jgi:hypothetical protein
MNLRLRIMKRKVRHYTKGPETSVHFVLVDTDNPSSYPLNFVCVLPSVTKLLFQGSTFARLFGENGLSFAARSLAEALETEKDPEIAGAIESRLKLIETPTAPMTETQTISQTNSTFN